MTTAEPPIPPSPTSPRDRVRRRQCALALAAAAAACLAPVAVLLAVLVLAPSLLPRLLLRPHHVVPYVSSAELRLLAFDPAASAVSYNLSATLRFDSPCLYCTWRYTELKATPSYAGQQLGAGAELPELTQRRGSDARDIAWAGAQKVPPGRRARAVAAALAREEAEGRLSVKVAVSTVQNGARSDFACVLSFPAVSAPRRGGTGSPAAAVFDGGRCVDAVPGEI
ncbi:hypothetical protein CFC21_005776 [Triticum aestivum]|uniref:Late embryogenesis abundant protein LEA-2 subgroup domain-containing protein n=2 Tax=Triticum aestivum TaxID=4565 RepID=A0A9R1IPV7_WHEAT|nr:hypothetical protein CFC21_005776 [Triticum aestivum]